MPEPYQDSETSTRRSAHDGRRDSSCAIRGNIADMGKRWVVYGLVVLVLAVFGGLALADTGGSMGGGDWGGGGGDYSGGGGGWSSSSGGGGWSSSSGGGGWSSSSSSDWSSSGGGGSIGCEDAGMVFFFLLLFLVIVGLVYLIESSQTPQFTRSVAPPIIGEADVSVLRIAIDGRARKFVQTELARIAKSADTSTAEGRTAMLREVSHLLRKLHDAWVYGGAVNFPMSPLRGAKITFDKCVDDARSRFREEVIRNADGQIRTREASAYSPRMDEGAGLILVSIIIAARRELFTVTRIGDGDDLRRALEGASQLTPGNLIAIEIVWQPAEDDDRLSSMELEAKYPRPDLIPLENALVGKTFCTYCSGPFPAELVSCPHCGAPAPGRDTRVA